MVAVGRLHGMTKVAVGSGVQTPIESIQVTGRYRKSLGDLGKLAQSIQERQLINPVVLTPELRLIAGQRRVEACRMLGWKYIDAVIVTTLAEAVEALARDRLDATEQLEMKLSERAALGAELELLDSDAADERRRATSALAGRVAAAARSGDPEAVGKIELPGRSSVRAIDQIGAGVGMSSTTYYKLKKTVEALHHLDPQVRKIAAIAVAEMDASGVINPSFDKVHSAISPIPQPPPRAVVQEPGVQRKMLKNAGIALAGICDGLRQIDGIHPDITAEEADQWIKQLVVPRRELESLIKRLKERSNA